MSMSDEEFEKMTAYFSWDTCNEMRARDIAQREALARVEAEHATWMEQYDSVVRYGNELLAKHDTAQAQLAEAVGLLRKVRMCGVLGESGPDVDSEIGQFLARHAQAEQQEAREPVLARPEHGVSMDEALALTMDRYSGALDQLAVIEQQEAQGAQAGGELDVVAEAIFNADKDNWYSVGPYSQLHANDKARLRAMARAALATQPAVPAVDKQSALPAESGWIEWGGNGTHAPFDEMLGADIRFRDGVEFSPPAVIGLRWNHAGNDKDIVAYRLHNPVVRGAEHE